MAVHLKLTDYPTISVLAPRTDVLTEIYRLEGAFDAATIAADLYQVFRQNNYWPADRPPPEPLPTSDLAYPNMICTPEPSAAFTPFLSSRVGGVQPVRKQMEPSRTPPTLPSPSRGEGIGRARSASLPLEGRAIAYGTCPCSFGCHPRESGDPYPPPVPGYSPAVAAATARLRGR
jgi:hypothetical protein